MTSRVLVTAFEPYGSWPDNSSLRCLAELTASLDREPIAGVEIVSHIYPVDFPRVRERLPTDLAGIDFAFHLGQSPGAASILLEEVAINRGSTPGDSATRAIEPGAPLAYASDLPLDDWAVQLREEGMPVRVSYHAGTYLCNAALFWTLHLAATNRWPTRALFVHLPFDIPQAVAQTKDTPSVSSAITARAVRRMLEWLPGK